MRNKLLYAALLCAPFPAIAHVTLVQPQAKPGAHFTAEFRVGHGCNGSPTTMLSIAIPDGVTDVMPKPKPGWTAELGNDSGRVRSVTWKGGILAADKPDSFSLDMVLPTKLGQLVFTAEQSCQTGSESWSDLPAADGHKLKNPAPILTITPNPIDGAGKDSMAGMDMSGMNMGNQRSAVTAPIGVTVQDAWIRALPSVVPSAGYFTLHNGGTKPVVLTGAESPGCGMLMLHKSEDNGGMSTMTDVSEVSVAVGDTAKFAPGGYHLMCMNSKPAIKPGASVPVTLSFKDGGKLTVQFTVRNASGN